MNAPWPARTQRVHGSTKTYASSAWVSHPENIDQLNSLFDEATSRRISVTARGHGCSYGPTITNEGGLIVDMSGWNQILDLDSAQGTATVQAGTGLSKILDLALPQGWVVRGVPGSPHVSAAGAASNNVHGKDCSAEGNFGCSVQSLRLLSADGHVSTVDREHDAELFRGIVGGMGLLGLVLEVTLNLGKVPGPFVRRDTHCFHGFDELFGIMDDVESEAELLVVWLDPFTDPVRGSVEVGHFTQAPGGQPAPPIANRPMRLFGRLPHRPLEPLIRPFMGAPAIRLHNSFRFRKERRQPPGTLVEMGDFCFPLAFYIPDLPALFPGGLLEAQIFVPAAARMVLDDALSLCHKHNCIPWLATIKRLRADEFGFSFSGDGYTMTMSVSGNHRRRASYQKFFNQLVDLVSEAGGTFNLSKDEMLTPQQIRRLCPDLPDFLSLKQRVDAKGLFGNDLMKRLTLSAN